MDRPEQQEQREKLKRRTPELLNELIISTKKLCQRRLTQLETNMSETRQAMEIAQAVGRMQNMIVMHISINLGDARRKWSFFHGDDSSSLGNDKPGKYTQVFRTMMGIQASRGPYDGFAPEMIAGRYANRLFVPAKIVDSGAVARIFAVNNISAMTVMDPLARQGLPSDTIANLDVSAMFDQSSALAAFLRELVGHVDLSTPRSMRATAAYGETKWLGTKSTGPSVRWGGGGGVIRTQPVRDATVALIPSNKQKSWDGGLFEKTCPGFSKPMILTTDVNGNFDVPVHPKNEYSNAIMFAAVFDKHGATDENAPRSRGLITAVTSDASLRAQPATVTKAGVDIVNVRSKSIAGYGYTRGTMKTSAMRDVSTANFRDKIHLLCELGDILTIYAPFDAKGFKLFNRRGMVLLNNTEENYKGDGLSLEDQFDHPVVLDTSSEGLLNLNAARLDLLSKNRITQGSLEILHGKAKALRSVSSDANTAEAKGKTLDERLGDNAAAAAVSKRVYRPLVGVMNDLVTAVVLLLLLAIPFAFALERLLIGTPHIYRQIGWFAVFFLLTFAVLFVVNPAFRIASTPIIIFLAFTIILLSSMVIMIMVRKLQNEIRKMQGLASTVHSADVSRLGTMMAAVSMGISTMRRRPLRTLLTATTVVLLTFTILTFASFGSSWGTRRTYEGPMNDIPSRIVLRHQLWGVISQGDFDALRGYLTKKATVVPRYWVSPTAAAAQAAAKAGTDLEMVITTADVAHIVKVSAAIGMDSRDIEKQPKLRELFTGDLELMNTNGIFLTEAVRDSIGLSDKDVGKAELCFGKQRLVFAGTVSDSMARHTMIEGSNMLPVDYQASSGGAADTTTQQEDLEALAETAGMESAQFLRYNLDEVVVVSKETARLM
ncbi:MAG: hypothetical protein J7M14_06920, partial [Planctomycetes bacterium]|nr:hypothetical protein [Planctomycetota bacterium]